MFEFTEDKIKLIEVSVHFALNYNRTKHQHETVGLFLRIRLDLGPDLSHFLFAKDNFHIQTEN